MKVTVGVPLHNAAPFLRESLESLLEQTHDDFEILAVDDGSTDESASILASYDDARLRVITLEQNRGYTHALNAALAVATGELFARQDADDTSRPDRLALQAAVFAADPEVVIVGSAAEVVDERGSTLRVDTAPSTHTAIVHRSLFQNPFVHSSVMFRRFDGVGYDASLEPSEDYALWTELLGRGRGANLPEPLVRYRVHGAQVSATRGYAQSAHADAISARSLAELGVEVDPADVARLRALAQSIAPPLSADDVRLLSLQIEATRALRARRDLDRRELRTLERGIARRALRAAPLRSLRLAPHAFA